jgi:hypothetical protein
VVWETAGAATGVCAVVCGRAAPGTSAAVGADALVGADNAVGAGAVGDGVAVAAGAPTGDAGLGVGRYTTTGGRDTIRADVSGGAGGAKTRINSDRPTNPIAIAAAPYMSSILIERPWDRGRGRG